MYMYDIKNLDNSFFFVLIFLGILYCFLGIYYGMIIFLFFEIKLMFFIWFFRLFFFINIFWFYIVNVFDSMLYIVGFLGYELY